MIDARDARHAILHKDPFAYCAHPHAIVTQAGTLLVVFNWGPRRAVILHPPEDPLFQNVICRSEDDGATWSVPQVIPDFRWQGTESTSLTLLPDGRVMLNQWRFNWYPLDLARTLPDQRPLAYPARIVRGWTNSPEHDVASWRDKKPEELAPWVRGDGETWVHFSRDDGHSFGQPSRIVVAPLSGGYGNRGAIPMPDGRILLPLSDVPHFRTVFLVESWDGGRSWTPPRILAEQSGSEFEEPTLLRMSSGRLIMVLRDNGTRRLHQISSEDGGANWSRLEPLPITGYPAQLLALPDGRILMTYGWRYPDFGVRAVLSRDEGRSWDVDNTIRIRGGLPNKNVGYPATVPTADGRLLTVYYGEDDDGVTCIMTTRWKI
jgi:hypothetical protein